jgi:hypothetical protein
LNRFLKRLESDQNRLIAGAKVKGGNNETHSNRGTDDQFHGFLLSKGHEDKEQK